MPSVREVPAESPSVASPQTPKEMGLLDILLVLAAHKWVILATSLAGLTIAIVASLIAKPTFTAQAVILPPQQEESSGSALLGQMSALASFTGMSGELGLKTPDELYVGILKSQTIANALIKQFGLMKVYHAKRPSIARAALKGASKFVSGKDGLITITVKDHDPRRAAAMANAYVAQLYKMNTQLAFSAASQKRLFFGQQLEEEKNRLADAEVAMQRTEEQTGVIAPNGQLETIIMQIAQLRAQITAHEVELDALRTSSTEQNPDYIRISTETDSLRKQVQDLEKKQGAHEPGDISITSANAPVAGLEYIRKERDLKYHQLLYEMLARQYEAARLDEAKQSPVIQEVDPATPPDWKSGPFRALWAAVGLFAGFALGAGWAYCLEALRKVRIDPVTGPKLAALEAFIKGSPRTR